MTKGEADASPEEQSSVTLVLGLRGALRYESTVVDEKDFEDASAYVSAVQFHAYHILSYYASSGTRETISADIPSTVTAGLVFHQTLIDQAIALARFGKSENAPMRLIEAAKAYTERTLEHLTPQVRAAGLVPRVTVPAPILQEYRKTMCTAIKNCLQISTPQNQVTSISAIHGISRKEAKAVCKRLSTSWEKRSEDAVEAYITQCRREYFSAQRELQRCGESDNLRARLANAWTLLKNSRRDARRRADLAEEALARQTPLPLRKSADDPPLEDILAHELAFLPVSQSQLDQLEYRRSLLSRVSQVDGASRFALLPTPKFGRVFFRVTKESVWNFVPGCSKKRPLEDSMDEAISRIFSPETARLISGRSGGPWNATSFSTDGCQVHFYLCNQSKYANKKMRSEKSKETKMTIKASAEELQSRIKMFEGEKRGLPRGDPLKKDYDLAIEDMKLEAKSIMDRKSREIKDQKAADIRSKKGNKKETAPSPRKTKSTPQALPPGTTLVGLDLGIVSIFGCAREDELDKKGSAWTASAGAFRHRSGESGRRYAALLDRRKKESTDPEFAEAHRLVDKSSVKTSDPAELLAALAARGRAYGILHGHYGSGHAASRRFLNFSGRQRELSRLVCRVAPKKTDVVVIGDASFGSTAKGHPPGLARRFVKVLRDTIGPKRIVECDEFRTSVLDSRTRTRMYHPVSFFKGGVGQRFSKKGKPYVRRVNGIYQCSSPGHTCTWDRDCNAARNIVQNYRTLMTEGDFPVEFRRSTASLRPEGSSFYKYALRPDRGCFSVWIDSASFRKALEDFE